MAKNRQPAPIDLILETSSALFLCGAAFAICSLVLRNVHDLTVLIVATSLPAAASLLMLVASLIVPGIYAVRRLSFPLNLTLPIIHGSLVFMLAELTRGSFGMESPPAIFRSALLWAELPFLGLAMVFQVFVLSVLVAIKGNGHTDAATDAQR